MKGWPMYQELQQLKELGLNKSQVARQLKVDWKTIDHYWEVTPGEFAQMRYSSKRAKKLGQYKDQIVRWLRKYPDISSAQIHDWLKEYYPDYQGKERTLRRLVGKLRIKYGIDKPAKIRQYLAVEELPLGYQAQVDLGFITIESTTGHKVKLCGLGYVLSYSRYKYVEWDNQSLTTARLITMLYRSFEFTGGIPEEIVFDQDKLVAVSENFGDVIYTAEFERFRQQMGFKVYLCRKNDPESKGKIEAVIKYAKNNYAKHRLFDNLTAFNQGCIEWLHRTANSSIHGTTKKIPVQVFGEEQKHLRPIPSIINIAEDIVTRQVRKDNTIWYRSNRYTLPLGSYHPQKEVVIKEEGSTLVISNLETGQELARHQISLDKGKLIKNNNHKRDHLARIAELYKNTRQVLGKGEEASILLDNIRREKPRYVRDQYQFITRAAAGYEQDILSQAIHYCVERRIFSAVEFKTVAEYFASLKNEVPPKAVLDPKAIPSQYLIKTEVRNISEYSAIYGGMNREQNG